jgi:hypothetical protein
MREVEDHLSGCDSCNRYFQTMSVALSSSPSQGGLAVDPYLPTRIRARANESVPVTGKEMLVRWSLRTAVFVVAIVVGVYMGEQISYQPAMVTDQHIISEYSNYLGEIGIGDRWQTVAFANEGGPK